MEILGKIGNTISSVSKEVANKTKELSGEVVKKTKELSDTAKISMQINSEKEAMQKKYQQIGEIYFKKYKGTDITDEELKSLCASVRTSLATIDGYQKEIQEMKGLKLCTQCKKELPIGADFCSYCGSQVNLEADVDKFQNRANEGVERTQAGIDAEILTEGTAICPICNAPHTADQLFCMTCGRRLIEEEKKETFF